MQKHDSDDHFDVVGAIMSYESGQASALETLELFSYLLRSGTIHGLQGSYHRALNAMLDNGLLDPETGEITDHAHDLLAALDEEDLG